MALLLLNDWKNSWNIFTLEWRGSLHQRAVLPLPYFNYVFSHTSQLHTHTPLITLVTLSWQRRNSNGCSWGNVWGSSFGSFGRKANVFMTNVIVHNIFRIDNPVFRQSANKVSFMRQKNISNVLTAIHSMNHSSYFQNSTHSDHYVRTVSSLSCFFFSLDTNFIA